MKKTLFTHRLLIFFVSLILVIVLIIPLLQWITKPVKELDVWIIDKTVPKTDYREHGGLFWIFNFEKIKNSNNQKYDLKQDYFGFKPSGNGYSIRNINVKDLEKDFPDLIYITDAYGVYKDDLKKDSKLNTKSELVYGKVTKDDLLYINASLKNNILIGEFNILQHPTEKAVSENLQKLFGIKWTGWYGRYYSNLERGVEVPYFLIKTFEEKYKTKWNFKGAGIIILSEAGDILVLEKGKDFSKKPIAVEFNKDYKNYYNAYDNVGFYYWFEIIEDKGAQKIANFKFNLSEKGKDKLKKYNIPQIFPAILKYKSVDYTSYYFAGDFADFPAKSGFYFYSIADRLHQIFTFEKSGFQDAFYWKVYVPVMKKILSEAHQKRLVKKDVYESVEIEDGITLKSKIQGKQLFVFTKNGWEKFFIKGVNLGLALPGKYFTQMPDDPNIYFKWFKMISDMNANVVRLYTLAPPEFYQALKIFNLTSSKKLYLVQEIWPDEQVPDKNYLNKSYTEEFKKEIEYVIDALHGKADIPKRMGRVYGKYNFDVSMYTIAILIGRELEPDEVITTDVKNNIKEYKGKYVKVKGSPSEVWLGMCCDYALEYETKRYSMQHPVGIVSWPTLDPISHPSEFNAQGRKDLEYNDKAQIQIDNFDIGTKNRAGIFIAYHIYPNYPDFMNNEEKYKLYKDEQGEFLYGGYLKELKEAHKKFPILVAEFGLSTSVGIAHKNPNGYHHGGIDEKTQGYGIVRMMKAIKKEGYMGGIIFEWMDEWAKKTWITEPFMIPYERHVLWHNRLDPEQNYGILANEALPPDQKQEVSGSKKIKDIEISSNAEYLYLTINLSEELSKETELLIGIDTYDRKRGEFIIPRDKKIVLPTGIEFLLRAKKDQAKLQVIPSYNWTKGRYSSEKSISGRFEDIIFEINKERVTQDGKKIPAIFHNFSILPKGKFDDSRNTWYIEKNKVYVRIPWGLLNVSDPSSKTVLDDNRLVLQPERDMLKTTKTDSFIFYFALLQNGKLSDIVLRNNGRLIEHKLRTWEDITFKERLKKSYYIIQKFFATFE
ncbi:hypothetical protein Calkro_2429 [Caldicellulosiruptor kronotskyensis 2002]|uniref:Uncharacterized protein n=1 Tax=Caldicellulosiruptor kronotskyensis (strain DSM 18902 / VKM B-2412 / 2002) TaxID=632348 RepID=E4SHL8_CALK2|nr:hypothetical protein Calkro_2429 [Caldicellulosiruptor kronotskyensis 2002]